MQRTRNEQLARFLETPGRFAVHGTGASAEAALGALAERGLKPGALVDDDRRGERFGLAIVASEEVADLDFETVVVAGSDPRDRTVRLRADGFEGRVLDLSGIHTPAWAAHHDEDLLAAEGDAIGFARSLLQDDGSRAVFDAVLAYRRSLDPGDLPAPSLGRGHPAVPIRDGEWILDVSCGDEEAADTTLAVAEAVGPLGRIFALSPRDERRDGLRATAETSALGARISVHDGRCGKPGEPEDEGDSDGPVTLDEFVWEETSGRVDRVRLDLPNARGILSGAAGILAEHRPRMAVCVGRGARDLFELPVLLKEADSGYRLHLSQHGQALASTFCYASPAPHRG